MSSPATNERTSQPIAPEQVEAAAVEWLRSELDDPEITAAENFLDIGGHSLTFSKLNIFLRDSFGVVLDPKITYAEPLSTAVAEMQPTPEPTST
ncbi:acyl carrier protein [Amycolatopsis sp. MEPSY49]|uniref:acyl carrier protein n=1 Tax=Amycolatopsis sp. MEPSY49 TaxID=3151600 RepID=UPI003EF5DE51